MSRFQKTQPRQRRTVRYIKKSEIIFVQTLTRYLQGEVYVQDESYSSTAGH